jgi:hypothetical protein
MKTDNALKGKLQALLNRWNARADEMHADGKTSMQVIRELEDRIDDLTAILGGTE